MPAIGKSQEIAAIVDGLAQCQVGGGQVSPPRARRNHWHVQCFALAELLVTLPVSVKVLPLVPMLNAPAVLSKVITNTL